MEFNPEITIFELFLQCSTENMSEKITITDLSPHLFWDVNPESLDMEKHKKYIIGRTLDYGLIDDWRLIKAHYGIETIAHVATGIKDLSPKSRALVSNLSGIPKEKFRCYITRQSTPQHWNF